MEETYTLYFEDPNDTEKIEALCKLLGAKVFDPTWDKTETYYWYEIVTTTVTDAHVLVHNALRAGVILMYQAEVG